MARVLEYLEARTGDLLGYPYTSFRRRDPWIAAEAAIAFFVYVERNVVDERAVIPFRTLG